VPSSKIPKRNSRSRVSKMSVNPYEIVGIRLDETNKQALMHEHVDKHAKMKKKKTKWVAQNKQCKHIIA